MGLLAEQRRCVLVHEEEEDDGERGRRRDGPQLEWSVREGDEPRAADTRSVRRSTGVSGEAEAVPFAFGALRVLHAGGRPRRAVPRMHARRSRDEWQRNSLDGRVVQRKDVRNADGDKDGDGDGVVAQNFANRKGADAPRVRRVEPQRDNEGDDGNEGGEDRHAERGLLLPLPSIPRRETVEDARNAVVDVNRADKKVENLVREAREVLDPPAELEGGDDEHVEPNEVPRRGEVLPEVQVAHQRELEDLPNDCGNRPRRAQDEQRLATKERVDHAGNRVHDEILLNSNHVVRLLLDHDAQRHRAAERREEHEERR